MITISILPNMDDGSTLPPLSKAEIFNPICRSMSDMGFRVLLIDVNNEPTLSETSHLHKKSRYGLGTCLSRGIVREDAISTLLRPQAGPWQGVLHLLRGCDVTEVKSIRTKWPEKIAGDQYLLRQTLRKSKSLLDHYDVIIIDARNTTAEMENAAVLASDLIMVPVWSAGDSQPYALKQPACGTDTTMKEHRPPRVPAPRFSSDAPITIDRPNRSYRAFEMETFEPQRLFEEGQAEGEQCLSSVEDVSAAFTKLKKVHIRRPEFSPPSSPFFFDLPEMHSQRFEASRPVTGVSFVKWSRKNLSQLSSFYLGLGTEYQPPAKVRFADEYCLDVFWGNHSAALRAYAFTGHRKVISPLEKVGSFTQGGITHT